jgi:hypothetical protein
MEMHNDLRALGIRILERWDVGFDVSRFLAGSWVETKEDNWPADNCERSRFSRLAAYEGSISVKNVAARNNNKMHGRRRRRRNIICVRDVVSCKCYKTLLVSFPAFTTMAIFGLWVLLSLSL